MEFTWLSRWQPQLLAILRIVVGLLFLEHALIKLAGFPPGGKPGLQHVGSFLWTVRISRADVAEFMLNQMTDTAYVGAAPGVCW